MFRRSTTMLLGLFALTVIGTNALAQDMEPRAYTNTPVGMNFIIAGYGFSEGSVTTDPSVPLTDAHLRTNATILAYARSLDLWGMSGKVDLITAYAWIKGHAEFQGQPREREISGFADPRLRISINLYGAPALTMKQFAEYKQDLIIGASLQVTAPLGQYDADKLVNVGTNRWAFRPEIGISKEIGPLSLELATDVTFYTDNDDFLGGKKREQDPMYSIQGHLVYRTRLGIWMALDGNYYFGGRTTVDGVRSDDLQQNSRAGITIALPVNKYNSVKLFGSTGIYTRTGSDFDTVGIGWQVRWGGGL